MKYAFTWVLALVTISVISTLDGVARAQSSGPISGATRVEIVLVGRAASDGSLAERIRSWFGPDAVLSITNETTLAADRVLGPHSTGVAVWVTLRAESARLYFAAHGDEQEATRYLVRDVPLDAGLDEIGSERVAQVVHSSVTALLEDSIEVVTRPDIERELAPPPAPAAPEPSPPPAPTPPHPVHSQPALGPSLTPLAGVFYRAAVGGDEGVAHGPGLALGGEFDFGHFGAGAVARGQYAFPHGETFDELEVTLSELAARAGALGFVDLGAFELDFELGGGAAWVHYDPKGNASGPLPAPRDTDQRFFWFGSAGFRRKLGPLELGFRLELELYPSLSHYELESGRELAVSPRYRPAFVLELVLD
jgi:hypothetical protein